MIYAYEKIGVCSVYIDYMAGTIAAVVAHAMHVELSLALYSMALLPLLLVYCWVHDLSALARFSAAANVATLVGLAVLFAFILRSLPPLEMSTLVQPTWRIPLCVGTLVFGFESITSVLPMHRRMKRPDRFLGKKVRHFWYRRDNILAVKQALLEYSTFP